MAAFLIILLATLGLAVRAVSYRRQWSAVNSEQPDTGFVDTCARTFILVFLSLLGLTALGMMFGNVLGSTGALP
jgi:ABC-type Fe3+ transport system permease subunit